MPLPHSPGLHTFNGGLLLKQAEDPSAQLPLLNVPPSPQLTLSLKQYNGSKLNPCVKPGEHVLRGQPIAYSPQTSGSYLHAPTSGFINILTNHAHIQIQADGEDQAYPKNLSCQHYTQLPPEILIQHIRNAGIIGMGGAGFPSHTKLNTPHTIHTLIINAAECEPGITCDDILIREHAEQIILGTHIIQHCLGYPHCIIGIEDCMQHAYAALQTAIRAQAHINIQLSVIPTRYPTGGERQLIKIITGREVPLNGIPADIGILCLNVGTIAAIYRAVHDGEPLTSRIVTINGNGINTPRNLHVRLGTPLHDLIPYVGGYRNTTQQLTLGGPMMGHPLVDDTYTISKTSNCILITSIPENQTPVEIQACIRCGWCEQVCPADLLPQQLHWHAKNKDIEQLQAYHLTACIECGCCSYVCPSKIPLVEQYREAKTLLHNHHTERQKATQAQQRHTARQQRLTNIEQQQQLKLAQKQQALTNQTRDEIQAMLKRAKAQKRNSNPP